ncbi:helix-turn-helix domain-containing protein [Burkholderia gladioli]|uniref:helix-turn-helix domain-containing protein n=1 Tax=Burkholderia gladioli TaxID=28095 RepID=UPI001FC896D0|nr:helix-turn-helix domain-containing protein [Burkholderia gladioli]
MNKPGLVTISMNELQRIKVIESVVEGRLTGVRAAERLGLTERQVSRLKRRFERLVQPAWFPPSVASRACEKHSQMPRHFAGQGDGVPMGGTRTPMHAAGAKAPSFMAAYNAR